MEKTIVRRNLITEILRDNPFVNAIFRNALRGLLPWSRRLRRITNRYRIYGTVQLSLEGVDFKIYARGDDFIANDIYYGNPYEREEFQLVKALTAGGRHFVDVGSNTGIFTIFAARANPAITALCFEPHPGNFKRISINLKLNNLGTVLGFPLAIGDSEGFIRFTIPRDESLSTTSSANDHFTRNFHDLDYKSIEVKQSTLDTILSGYPLAGHDLFKIDVEYYELNVLRGMHRILSEVKPAVLVEVLQYEDLVSQFPSMSGKIYQEHAHEIEILLSSYGYFPHQLSAEGVYRIDTTLTATGARNFLFLPVRTPDRLISYAELGNSF